MTRRLLPARAATDTESGSQNGLPQNVRTSDVRQAWNSENGIFYIPTYGGREPNTVATVPLELTGAGTGLQSYNTGGWSDGMPFPGSKAAGDPNRTEAIGGSGEGIYEDQTLRSNIERETIFAAFTYDITDRLGFFVDMSGGSVDTFSPQDALAANGLCIQPDNAFIQDSPEIMALFDNPDNLNCGGPPGTPATGILTKKNWVRPSFEKKRSNRISDG